MRCRALQIHNFTAFTTSCGGVTIHPFISRPLAPEHQVHSRFSPPSCICPRYRLSPALLLQNPLSSPTSFRLVAPPLFTFKPSPHYLPSRRRYQQEIKQPFRDFLPVDSQSNNSQSACNFCSAQRSHYTVGSRELDSNQVNFLLVVTPHLKFSS